MSAYVHVFALSALAMLAAGCEREKRHFEVPPSASVAVESLRMSQIAPGAANPAPHVTDRHEDNAYALAEGKRLYGWYNCNGCHAEGGGGIGPALMDPVWIYGSEPANVFATIVQGRPNGMPAYGGRIPENEVWELVAYVRSMSGLAPQGAAPDRADAMHVKKPESEMKRQPPVSVSVPHP